MNEKKTQIRAVFCQLMKDPMRCTKKMPKDWARETVVRKAPRFLGLVYSPIKTERSGRNKPNDRPWRTLPITRT